jgi:hypothetical protein
MTLGRKSTASAIFYYLLGCAILCMVLALATIVGVIVVISLYGPGLFVDGYYVSLIVGIFLAITICGSVWFTIRFVNWKKSPEDLVRIEGDNLVIYTRKGEVVIAKDDIDTIIGVPESLFIKYLVRDYGVLHIDTTGKNYKVHFVEGVTSLPNQIFNALGLTNSLNQG